MLHLLSFFMIFCRSETSSSSFRDSELISSQVRDPDPLSIIKEQNAWDPDLLYCFSPWCTVPQRWHYHILAILDSMIRIIHDVDPDP